MVICAMVAPRGAASEYPPRGARRPPAMYWRSTSPVAKAHRPQPGCGSALWARGGVPIEFSCKIAL